MMAGPGLSTLGRYRRSAEVITWEGSHSRKLLGSRGRGDVRTYPLGSAKRRGW